MATINDKDANIQRAESLEWQTAKVLAFFILKHLPSGVEPSCGCKRRVVKLFEFCFYLFVEVIEIARHRGALQLHCGNDPSLCGPYTGLDSVFLLGTTGLTRPWLNVIAVPHGAYRLLYFALVPARVLNECLCIVHDENLRRATEVFKCVNDAGDPARLLLIGKSLGVGEVAVRQHRDKQPRTLYVSVRINPLEVVSGEVSLHTLTGGGLDIAVGYAKAVGLPPLCVTATKGSVGVCASDDL